MRFDGRHGPRRQSVQRVQAYEPGALATVARRRQRDGLVCLRGEQLAQAVQPGAKRDDLLAQLGIRARFEEGRLDRVALLRPERHERRLQRTCLVPECVTGRRLV